VAKPDSANSGLTITISGPVTAQAVVRLRDTLLGDCKPGERLRLDLSATTSWDLLGLQLLISTAATAREIGSSLRVDSVPPGLNALANRAGATEFLQEIATQTGVASST
jgi:anti-anti-sigma regulatory factor